MRYIPRRRLRRGALSLVAAVALAAVGFATWSFTSGDVAHATDDWTAGHDHPQQCFVPEFASAFTHLHDPVHDVPGGYGSTYICWGGPRVDVRGYAKDMKADGYCAVDRIRYKIKYTRHWSHWHYRNMATACGNGTEKHSSYWWSRHYAMKDVHSQTCLRDSLHGTVLKKCSTWR